MTDGDITQKHVSVRIGAVPNFYTPLTHTPPPPYTTPNIHHHHHPPPHLRASKQLTPPPPSIHIVIAPRAHPRHFPIVRCQRSCTTMTYTTSPAHTIHHATHHTPPHTIHHLTPPQFFTPLSTQRREQHSFSMATYSTEGLPEQAHVFNGSETKRYRDCVCEIFNLIFTPIDGDGNCFFESVVTLLALVPNLNGKRHLLDATELRARVIEWLRNCGGRIADVCNMCMFHMQDELAHPLTCLSGNKWVQRKPKDLADYLEVCSQNGVWVQGRTPPYTTTTTTYHPHTPPPLPTPSHRVPLATRGGRLV